MSSNNRIPASGDKARRPSWLRVKIENSETYREVNRLVGSLNLHTVCEEARCPNIWECWGKCRTATFMILGDVCTRSCRYCSVKSGQPQRPDPDEPENVARAVSHLKLAHAVITSVERDDLSDFGAGQFIATIGAIRARCPQTKVEVLIPELGGSAEQQKRLFSARPDVLNHNVETVPRLFPKLRPRGDFERSLELLNRAHAFRLENAQMLTKSGLMVGLGETLEEVIEVMERLRGVNCDVLTIGQYLNPTRKHAPIKRFYTPEEFASLQEEGLRQGFLHVESGPLVRSSYHASSHAPVENGG